jgi:hypothetical protein
MTIPLLEVFPQSFYYDLTKCSHCNIFASYDWNLHPFILGNSSISRGYLGDNIMMRQTEIPACMEVRDGYNVLTGKPERKRPLVMSRYI